MLVTHEKDFLPLPENWRERDLKMSNLLRFLRTLRRSLLESRRHISFGMEGVADPGGRAVFGAQTWDLGECSSLRVEWPGKGSK